MDHLWHRYSHTSLFLKSSSIKKIYEFFFPYMAKISGHPWCVICLPCEYPTMVNHWFHKRKSRFLFCLWLTLAILSSLAHVRRQSSWTAHLAVGCQQAVNCAAWHCKFCAVGCPYPDYFNEQDWFLAVESLPWYPGWHGLPFPNWAAAWDKGGGDTGMQMLVKQWETSLRHCQTWRLYWGKWADWCPDSFEPLVWMNGKRLRLFANAFFNVGFIWTPCNFCSCSRWMWFYFEKLLQATLRVSQSYTTGYSILINKK